MVLRPGTLLAVLVLLVHAAWSEPRVRMPVSYFDPRDSKWKTFDRLDTIRQDSACGWHLPGLNPPIGLVGKIVEALCNVQFLVGIHHTLCLDGVEVGEATFIQQPDDCFRIETDEATSELLLKALAEQDL